MTRAGFFSAQRALEVGGVGVAVAAGLLLRFYTPSALWEDEALTVNIARLPLSEIPGALAADGHPPLFYLLLHAWIGLAGTGDWAVRALSGVFSVALLPLLWVAGRRLGGPRCAWASILVVTLSPFALFYANAARMYALVMLLSLAGTLLVGDNLDRPRSARLAALTLVSGLLLLSHYWCLWPLAATIVVLATIGWRAWRTKRRAEWRTVGLVLAAVVAGGLLALPWAPVFLQQLSHTGTPWGDAVGLPRMVRMLIKGFCGAWGRWLMVPLALVGVALACRERPRSPLGARAAAAVFLVTILIGFAGAVLAGTAFVARYAAALFPLFALAVARGCAWFDRPVAYAAVLGFLLALNVVDVRRDLATPRTTAPLIARVIESQGTPGDVVAYCPDELGPAVSRVMAAGFDQVTYPRLGAPDRVDFRDYALRLSQADPRGFVAGLVARAGNRDIWLVFSDRYRLAARGCTAVRDLLREARPAGRELLARTTGVETTADVYRFPLVPTLPAR